MDEKIEKFLDDAIYDADVKLYNSMVEDAEKLDTKSFIDKYQSEIEKHNELALAWKSHGLDKYGKDKWLRYREAFGSSDKDNPFDKDEAWLQATWQNDFSDIPYEQYKQDIESNKQFWDDEQRAREYNAGRLRRTKEIKDWPLWKQVLASDYSKQRYIDEPDASLFGKEGKFNPYSRQGQEELSDVIFGGFGAAADAIPGYGAVAGPTLRAVRDIKHKVTDSPYQKEWSNIGQDALTDAAINAGVEFMPTAILNRGRRLGKNIGKTDELISDYAASVNVAQRQKANDAALEYLKKNEGMFDDARVAQIRVNAMPESDIKNDLVKLVNSDDYSKRKLLAYMDAIEKANIEGIDAYKYVKSTSMTRPNKNIKAENLGDNAIDFYRSKERVRGLPESKTRNVVGKVMTNYMPVGQTIVKEIDTAKGRGSTPEADKQLVKDWYKQNYARDWELGFKPNEKEGDPLWEAYIEWKEGK